MHKWKILFASIIGTALEFYDFMLFLVFVETIGKVYFPSGSDSFTVGWFAFATAFLMRPFGATVFGHIGDKFGRKRALVLTVSLMGIPTFMIGALPGYETIGILAPITLVICRLVQGLCTGGEYNGSAIFALEHVGKSYPGTTGGMITGASIVGALGANIMGYIFTLPDMGPNAWRIPFLLGAVISIVGLYMRLYISESPAFEKLQKRHKVIRSPLTDALLKHKSAVFLTIVIGMLNGLLSYTLFKFINLYLSKFLNVDDHIALEYSSVGLIVYIIAAPLMGFLLDKVGAKKTLMGACMFIFLTSLPIFFLIIERSTGSLIIAQIIMALCVAAIAGPQHAFVQTLFPAEDRYSGVAFSFCVGMGIGGGIFPYFMLEVVEKTQYLFFPPLFIMVMATLFLLLLWRGKICTYDSE